MQEPSDFLNVYFSWKHYKAQNLGKQLHPLQMHVLLKTNKFCSGITTLEKGNDCSNFLRFLFNRRTVRKVHPQRIPRLERKRIFRMVYPQNWLCLLFLLFSFLFVDGEQKFEQYMPTKCESCLIFGKELERSASRISNKMRKDEAEAWFVDEFEHICERMLGYRLHKEKEGLTRFSKEVPKTAKMIKDLKARGVEVKLDVPDDLLNYPSIESGRLKNDCEWIISNYENVIERWFFKRRHQISISDYLCRTKLSTEFAQPCSVDQLSHAEKEL